MEEEGAKIEKLEREVEEAREEGGKREEAMREVEERVRKLQEELEREQKKVD